jgi:hypothetical protein
MAGAILRSDVAARDVQAATSAANQIAHAKTKSRSFAGGGTGQRGSRSGKVRVFGGCQNTTPYFLQCSGEGFTTAAGSAW